jgi:hypothetical protein
MSQQHRLEILSWATHRPRVRDLPRCAACAGSIVAPEASAQRADGEVSCLWSCDCCGQSVVTNAANVTGLKVGYSDGKARPLMTWIALGKKMSWQQELDELVQTTQRIARDARRDHPTPRSPSHARKAEQPILDISKQVVEPCPTFCRHNRLAD